MQITPSAMVCDMILQGNALIAQNSALSCCDSIIVHSVILPISKRLDLYAKCYCIINNF